MSTIRKVSLDYRTARQKRREARAEKARAQQLTDMQAALKAGAIRVPVMTMPSKVEEIAGPRAFEYARRVALGQKNRPYVRRMCARRDFDGGVVPRELHTYDRITRSKYVPHVGKRQLSRHQRKDHAAQL